MKVSVQVKAGSKIERLEALGPDSFRIWVREPAQEGRANKAVAAALATHLKVLKSRLKLLHGAKSKSKVFEVVLD